MPWPALLIAGLAVLGGVGVLWDRHHQGRTTPRASAFGSSQLFAVYMLIPAIVILATTGLLEPQTTATLIGAIVGYILSGIGKDERSPCALGFSWTLDCERVLAGGVSR